MQAKYFLRDATGLVRSFGAVDTLLFSSAMVFALVFTITQFAWFYGNTLGANLPLSLLLGAIPFVFLMLAYWAIAVVMPRTGNDYVWVGRIFSPAIGFAWAALYMVVVFLVAYVGEVGPFSLAFSSAFTSLGLTTNSASLTNLGNYLGSAQGTFLLAAIFTIVFGAFAVFGNRLIKRFLYGTWIVAIIGMALMWFILGTTSNATFISHWNSMIGTINPNYMYSTVQTTATTNSVNGATFPGFSSGFTAIVTALPLAFLFLFGGNYANAFAGEIKNIRRSIPIALFLSLIFGIIYWTITSSLTLGAVGHNWMTAVGWGWDNGGTGSSTYALPFAPTQTLLLAVAAYPNNALISVMYFTYLAGSLGALFTYFWIPSKYFFAWSFDRVIPSKFAAVSSKYNTPYISILAIVVLGVVLSYVYSILGYSVYFTMGTVLWGVSYVVPGLAVMLFPFLKKNLFAQAPGWVKAKIGGFPVVSLIGLATSVGFALVGFIAYGNPAIGIPNAFSGELALTVLVLAFVVFFAGKFYHKSRGLDISMALREIPPE